MKLAEKALTSRHLHPLLLPKRIQSQIVSFLNLQDNATTIVEEE
jgi:hypothetical protein